MMGATEIAVPATLPMCHPHITTLERHIAPHDVFDRLHEPIPDALMTTSVMGIEAQIQTAVIADFPKPKVLVVNLFGGPGTGKSTNAALLFGKLKIAGVNAELVTEYAKDLTWEKRHNALGFQPYVTFKQAWRVARLRDEVEVIVTDSPFLLGLVYPGFGSTPSFEHCVVEIYDLFHNYNVFLSRESASHPYNPSGRKQSESQARQLDREILSVLHKHEINHEVVPVMEGEETANYLRDSVLRQLAALNR